MARFRQCFVDALKPKHLSSSWQINHRYGSQHTSGGSYKLACTPSLGTPCKLKARSCVDELLTQSSEWDFTADVTS